MSSSREQREMAEFDAWVEALDPQTADVDDPEDLRAVADAADNVNAAERRLRDAVMAARDNGRTWTQIAVGLGVSRQAATKRFASITSVASAPESAKSIKNIKNKGKGKGKGKRIAMPRVSSGGKISSRVSSNVIDRGGTRGGRESYDIAAQDKRRHLK